MDRTRTTQWTAMVALLVSLVATGCGVSDRYDASELSPEQFAAAELVAEDWCVGTEGVFCPTLDGGSGDNRIVFRDSFSTTTILGEAAIPLTFSADSIEIRILTGLSDSVFKTVLRHELGHAGALRDDHLPPGNIMARTIAGNGEALVDTLTDADIDYVVSARE